MSAGVYAQGISTISNNIIDSISSGTPATTLQSTALCGINITSATSGTTLISGNSITNLILTHPTVAACAGGILIQNTVTAKVNTIKNIINNIATSTSAVGIVAGIADNNATGSDTIMNNVISLGNYVTNSNIRALYDLTPASSGTSFHVYMNNTVVLSGNQTSSGNSTTFFRSASTNNVVLRNNILVNLRTVGGTGFNYVIYNNNTATTTTWKGDYNLLYNSDPAKTVYWSTGAANYTLAGYKGLFLSDTNSVTGNVPFASVANNDLHIVTSNPDAWNVFGRGIVLNSLTNDADGNPRSTTLGVPTTIGAYEIAMPSATPADMVMTPATPVLGTPTVFTSLGRKIAEITWTGASVPTAMSAKYYPGVPPPATITSPNINSYFDVTATPDAGSTYTIKTYYTTAEANGIADASLWGMKKSSTGTYTGTTLENTTPASDANGKYLQSFPLSSFSIFSMTGNSTPLSIDLKTIAAKNVGNKNRIDWSTAKESKADYFELESSTDARNFTKIARINAKGQASAYTYMDEKAALGVTYYRLKMTIDNGSFVYSKTVNAEVKSLSRFAINAYPNPVQNKVSLNIEGNIQGNAMITVADVTGKTLQSLNVTGNEMNIDMNNLATGIYFIKYSDDQKSQTLKIIKQ